MLQETWIQQIFKVQHQNDQIAHAFIAHALQKQVGKTFQEGNGVFQDLYLKDLGWE